jgi:ubiquinone/menaquinone biosynthesis C-methylase UbiE
MSSSTYEENSPDGWAKRLQRDPFAKYKLQLDHRWKIIKKHMNGRILDAGCGRGDWVNFLTEKNYTGVGLDYSQEMVESNNKLLRGEFHFGRTQQMPFRDEEFDGIISWGVIEHDPAGPHAALTEFHRVLKNSGHIFVTVPVDNIYQRAASLEHFPSGDEFFQYFFTQDELSRAVEEAGFQIVLSAPIGRPHPALIWPKLYRKSGAMVFRLLQIAAMSKPKEYANMIGVLAQKRPR